MDQYIGRLLDDRYEILEIIGTGGGAAGKDRLTRYIREAIGVKI